jgi:multiple sugar transport system ATP-binding protein
MAEVALHGVSKAFGATRALDDVTLTVPDGSFMVLVGPTGAGKTTALRLVAGLERADAGSVRIGGEPADGLTPAQRDVAMVFQQYSLYPHLTVAENLAFPLRSPLQRLPEDRIRQRVGEVAEVLRISAKLGNRATRLSGGEMQRVSIGRALVRSPRAYLMDEPLSSLDAKLRADLRVELRRIHAELGATFLYVTHDQIEAMTMATRVGVLDGGRLEQVGPPREVYEDPVSVAVAQRLGSPRINLLPADALGPAPARARHLGLRPEAVEVVPGGDGAVRRVERLGDQTRLHLALGPHALVALAPSTTALAPGDRVAIHARARLWFDDAGRRIPGA